MLRAWLAASAAVLFAFAAAPVAGADPLGPFSPLGCFEDDVNAQLRCAPGRQLADLRTPRAIDVSPDAEQVYVGMAGSDFSRGGIAIFDRNLATGDLTPAGCVKDVEAGGLPSCATSATAVGFPRDLAVSPDGRSVYTVTDQGGTIARLDRDTSTGALAYAECFEPPSGTRCGAGHQVAGLIGLNGLVVSPDGTSVYTFALTGSPGPGGRGAVARFARDTGTGALTYQGCLGPSGTVGCTVTAAPIGGTWDGAMSADSTSLYVSGSEDAAVVHLSRDTGDGSLTPQACVELAGGSNCSLETPAFGVPEGLTVSADGKSVYVTALIPGTLARLDRNPATGALTPSECFRTDELAAVAGCTPVKGLRGAIDVEVSPDGSRVYVSGRESAALVDFARATTTGALTPDGCVNAPVSSVSCGGAAVPGISDTFSFAVSPDGTGLLAAGLGDNAVVVFGAGGAGVPPTAVGDTATVAQGSAATALDVLANDTDPDGGPKQVVSVTDPARGTTAVTGAGTGLSYRPDDGFCGGPDTFSYALNGGSVATVAVTVTCAARPPGAPGSPGGPVAVVPPPAQPSPAAPAATPPVAVGCAPDRLILTDVFPSGTRTRLLGVAPASAVGGRVAIVSAWNRRTVARAVVRADLTFEATAPLPPRAIRATDKARFFATLGARKSLSLKFARRAYTTAVRVSGRRVTFSGMLTKPLAGSPAPVVVRASASCTSIGSGAVVATVKPTPGGTFVARFDVPAGRDVVYLRAESRVRRTTRTSRTFPTFTLVRGIRFGR